MSPALNGLWALQHAAATQDSSALDAPGRLLRSHGAAQVAQLLEAGEPLWLLTGGDVTTPWLVAGTEAAARVAVLEWCGLEVWPSDWTLARVGVVS